jgi:hypothetical protein
VVVIGCEFIASVVDGDADDAITDADVALSCGGTIGGVAQQLPPTGPISVQAMANIIGNQDGFLSSTELRSEIPNGGANAQISDSCRRANFEPGEYGSTVEQMLNGFSCTLLAFVFVNDEKPVTIDPPAGVTTIQDPSGIDFTCSDDGVTLTTDNDCDDGAGGGLPNNGDGVVVFHLLADIGSSIGDIVTVRITQEAVEQAFELAIVGPPNNIELELVEATIEANGSLAAVNQCSQDMLVGLAIPEPAATLARVRVLDREDNSLARTPVQLFVVPASDELVVAAIGERAVFSLEGVNGRWGLTTAIAAGATEALFPICGGALSGQTDIEAQVVLSSGSIPSVIDASSQTIDVVEQADADDDGVPNAEDNCIHTSNFEQTNTDAALLTTPGAPDDSTIPNSDAHGDACDGDDDNDFRADAFEGIPCVTSATLPLVSDSDGDRVLDGVECALVTDPMDAGSKPTTLGSGTPGVCPETPAHDDDGDRLSNALESQLGTDSCDGDSDNDSVPDGAEFLGYGTSPLAPDSDGDGLYDCTEIGDVNGNAVVNAQDLGIIASVFNRSDRPVQDVDKNGRVNAADLGVTAAILLNPVCASS